MVGLKTFWIIIFSLWGLSACVPMAKQTDCGTNEAFNAGLRTCVPVVGGPTAFIDVDTFSPQSTLFLNKNDSNIQSLSITIKNPYAEKYSVQWTRRYNALTETLSSAMTSGAKSEYRFIPRSFGAQIGTHLFEVLVKDARNAVVDEHVFSVVITEVPKPILTAVDPVDFSSDITPRDLPKTFKVTISNNKSAVTSSFKTEWTVTRMGSTVATKSEPFTNRDTNAVHTSSFDFNPATLGIGSYILTARVTNGAINQMPELFGERQWSIAVKHPALSKIIAQNIYKTGPTPSFTTTSVAYTHIPYNEKTAYNFIPMTTPASTAQGNYCITVENGTGTYPNDGKFVRVDFYVGGNNVVSVKTSENNGTICLSDGGIDLSKVVFKNSTTLTESQNLVAQVYDEASEEFYSNANITLPSPATYPITWKFDVRPQNRPPAVSFGTITTVAAPTVSLCSGTNSPLNCEVNSDTSLTVKIKLDNDDFYSIPANLNKFGYSLKLLGDNGSLLDECPRVGETIPYAYNDGFSCTFNIKSYGATGPINLANINYQIKGEIYDFDSPITSTRSTSTALIWNFAQGKVKEVNNSLAVTASVGGTSAQPVSEGANLPLTLTITDEERDHFNYAIRYCKTNDCSSVSLPILTGLINRTSDTNPLDLNLNYTLSQNFLHDTPCANIARDADCEVTFQVSVEDVPNNAGLKKTASVEVSSFIKNINPVPVFNTASSSPQTNDLTQKTYEVFVGAPFTIKNSNSFLSDLSISTSEKPNRYQWFVRKESDTTWEKITGATSLSLTWTPSLLTVGASGELRLKLCVEDQPTSVRAEVHPTLSPCTDGINGSDASKHWKVKVLNNVAKIHALPSELSKLETQAGKETALWHEASGDITATGNPATAVYVAMIGNDKQIHVKKVLTRDRKGIDRIHEEAVAIVSFPAFDPNPYVKNGEIHTDSAAEVKNLSITGYVSTDGKIRNLYISYLASKSGVNNKFYPQVRRIDISPKRDPSTIDYHPGMMGFSYNYLTMSSECLPFEANCELNPVSGNPDVPRFSFDFTGQSSGLFQLKTTNLGDFTITFDTFSNGINRICSGCSDWVRAQGLVDIINNSQDFKLAGFSAKKVEPTQGLVDIDGSLENDYFDASKDFGDSSVANQIGKIFVANGRWHLPFIASGAGNKIHYYKGDAGKYMKSTGGIHSTPVVLNTDTASIFDNYFDGTNLWIALATYSGSVAKLYQLNSTTLDAIEKERTIFPGFSVTDIQVSSSYTHNVFVAAKTSVPEVKYKIGMYSYNLDSSTEHNIDSLNLADAETIGHAKLDNFNHLKIVPYGEEARVFFIHNNSTDVELLNYKLYVARLRKNLLTTESNDWTLSCGECQPISEFEAKVSPFVKLDVADIRNQTVFSRLSSDGGIIGEGIRDMAYVSFGRIGRDPTSGQDDKCEPALGVFNMRPEAISTNSIFEAPGTLPIDGGLFRNAFIRD